MLKRITVVAKMMLGRSIYAEKVAETQYAFWWGVHIALSPIETDEARRVYRIAEAAANVWHKRSMKAKPGELRRTR